MQGEFYVMDFSTYYGLFEMVKLFLELESILLSRCSCNNLSHTILMKPTKYDDNPHHCLM